MMRKACSSTSMQDTPCDSVPAVAAGRCFADGAQYVRNDARGKVPSRAHDEAISVDLDVAHLRRRLQAAGNLDEDMVYGYVVATVQPVQGPFQQRGSGPNWQGNLITLCTCKHTMRATLKPEEWMRGKWVVGLTGWSRAFANTQSLVYLMKIGSAYSSHAELVQSLQNAGLSAVVAAKDASVHPLGDIMTPSQSGFDWHDPFAYSAPVLGHAHRKTEDSTDWHRDVDHRTKWGTRPALLVGDPEHSFRWTRPIVQRCKPGHTRPYRIWSLREFLNDLEEVRA